jgi:hypothetical protein
MYRKTERRPRGRYLNDPFVNAIDRDSEDHHLLESLINTVAQAILKERASLRSDCPRAATVSETALVLQTFLEEETVRPAWARAAFLQALPLLDLGKIIKEIWPELKKAKRKAS